MMEVLFQIILIYVSVGNRDGARHHPIIPEHQLDEGGIPTSGGPDNSRDLTLRYVKRHTFQ